MQSVLELLLMLMFDIQVVVVGRHSDFQPGHAHLAHCTVAGNKVNCRSCLLLTLGAVPEVS